ncbi:MAG: PD-(D/E)XK nuclease family protein [Pseudomonadota bacterium]
MTQHPVSDDSLQAKPFAAAFEWLSQAGLDASQVLWVMPRIETVGSFKRHWAQHHTGEATLGPWVQTADRLSQPAAMGPWLALQADLVGVLRELPLLGGGSSPSQLWGLAQEYLELALRQVLVQKRNTSALATYSENNTFAAEEAQVVATLAQTYAAELMDLLPKPAEPWGSPPVQVVWFDDGETVPGLWLDLFYPEVPVQVFKLPVIEGPQPWQILGMKRFNTQVSPVVLQVAPDETTQAQQAAHQILEWLRTDPTTEIAVAVLDRLAARRMVGLLADMGVLVDDRTGWRLSTSNVAGWFDHLLQQFVEHGQLTTIAQPFTGLPIEHLEPWSFGKAGSRHTLAQWAGAFLALFKKHGLDTALQPDEAGQQLLTVLGLMRQVPAHTEFDAQEFVAGWRSWAESQRFRPLDIESPVRMVPLLSTRMRQFKRVLVLGCAQSHFQESPPGLLPPAVAQELGFPGPRLARIQKIAALYELLLHSDEITLVHSAQVAGKPEMLLPELTWLDIVLRDPASLSQPWSGKWYRAPSSLEIEVREAPEQALQLTALSDSASVPDSLRVTALDDWVACRLRFGLKHALPWPPQRDQGAMRYEQLRGIFVHKVLERTAQHMALPGQAVNELQVWKETLLNQAEAVWSKMELPDQAMVYPFLKFFDQIVPRLAGKLMERQIQGWQFKSAEQQLSHTLVLQPSGVSLELKGRIDRVDTRGDALAISDIKFTNPTVLKKRLAEPLSQPQLPAYQAMLNSPSAQLDFLGLHKDKVDWVSFPPLSDEYREQGFQSWGEVLLSELSRELNSFFEGKAVWQANPGDACEYCAVRGVCRPETHPTFNEAMAGEEGGDE